LPRGFEHLGVDENVVAADIGMGSGDITDAAHIGGEVVNLVEAVARGQFAMLDLAKIQNLELIRGTGLIFGIFNVGAPDPVAIPLQSFYEVMPNESSRARYQNPLLSAHPHSLLTDLRNLNRLQFVFASTCDHSEI
jgi:hypothetical protein